MREAFLSAGCDLVLTKPVTRTAVLGALDAVSAPSTPPRVGPDPASMPEAVRVDPDLMPMIPAFLDSLGNSAPTAIPRFPASPDLAE